MQLIKITIKIQTRSTKIKAENPQTTSEQKVVTKTQTQTITKTQIQTITKILQPMLPMQTPKNNKNLLLAKIHP